MDKLKKYLIRGTSILMATLLLVMSPLSDYADTQGIGETHATGAGGVISLITGSSLMPFLGWALGVGITVAGASYIYNEYKEYIYYGGDADLISIIDNIEAGIYELNITEKLINSFATFMENVKGLDLDGGVPSYAYGSGAVEWNYAENNAYYNSFMNFYDSVSTVEDYAIVFDGTTSKVYYLNGLEEMYAKSGVVTCIYAAKKSDTKYFYGAVNYSSSDGLFVERIYNSYGSYRKYTYSADGWIDSGTDIEYEYGTAYGVSTLIENSMSLVPVYLTPLTGFHFGYYETLQELMENSTYREEVASSYGSYDQANLDRLLNATVTETQLQAVNNELLPQIQNEQENGSDAQTIADLMSFLLADALVKNAIGSDTSTDDGTTDTPTDTPVDGATVGEQAIIDQSITNTTGIKGAIQSATNAITDFFTAPLENILSGLQSILEAVIALPATIIDGILTGISTILSELFVPDTERLMDRISILAPVVAIIDTLGKFFNCFSLIDDSEPPYMYIHFENAEDERFQSIGTLKILDMAWYEPYKPYGDLIFSCVIWLFLMLRIFKAIPSILNGMSGGGEIPDSTYEPSGDTPFPKIGTRGFTMK